MRFFFLSLCWLGTLALYAQKNPNRPERSPGRWQMQDSHTTSGLRGIHNVGAGVAWASGTDGTVLRTEDGGYLWQNCAVPPGAARLDFRGVWAWNAQTAVAMSSGPGDLSRLYRTTDGCGSWKLLYTNPEPKGFWDAIAFRDKDHGFILGDPVDGRFVLLSSADGGVTWLRDPGTGLKASDGQGAFAASNSSLVLGTDVDEKTSIFVRFGTGGPQSAAVFDFWTLNAPPQSFTGEWHSGIVPLASGDASSGVFSLAFRVTRKMKYAGNVMGAWYQYGIAVGGDYQKPNQRAGTAAWTTDGGKTWTAAAKPPHGYRSAVAWDGDDKAWIAAGTNGSDVSYDEGKTWRRLDDGNWNALSLPWVVGPMGKIGKLLSLRVTSAAAEKAR